jgi:integrase
LARWAEIKLPKDWPYFKGDYQSENIDKEPLSDEEILKVRERLEKRRKTNNNSYYGWLWIFGMMATYGLRPHEVFNAELFIEDGIYLCRIPESTKTGKRLAFPLSPDGCDWVSEWNLPEKWLPNIRLEGKTNKQLGAKISAYFYSLEIEISPYELRHAYARRGIVGKGIDSVYIVSSMGHSIATHIKYYGRYLNQVSLAKIGKYAVEKMSDFGGE